MKVLIASVSSRALAQSAAAAGYEVISLDFFGDSDFPEGTRAYSLARDFHCKPNLKNLAASASVLAGEVDAMVIGAGIENEPSLSKIKVIGKRWYNSPEAVLGVRDLNQVNTALQDLPILFPKIIYSGGNLHQTGQWLIKDLRRSGGVGVRDWDGSTKFQKGQLLQEFIEGELASATFMADGEHARLIGLSRQYAGVRELNAPSYAWCGNVAPWGDKNLVAIFDQVVERLANTFGLVGVNGIDFIVREGMPYLLEVNPRPCGSGELFEKLLGINLFQMHVHGCEGKLDDANFSIPEGKFWGKGILYAPQEVIVGDTSGWVDQGIADIPHSGERIPTHAPVCTLTANASDPDSCWMNVLNKRKSLQLFADNYDI